MYNGSMNRWKAVAVLTTALLVLGAAAASAQDGFASRTEFSLMGGIQVLNENDTALPDHFVNVPAVATLTYRLTPVWALEGEFTWMIPVPQDADPGTGVNRDLETPDVLAYQANVKGSWPIAGETWSPYLVGGIGAVTFLSNTDENRRPQLDESETMFAINFGTGLNYGLTSSWSLRADFREFVAFPAEDATGLSSGGEADPIWMERGTLGLTYSF